MTSHHTCFSTIEPIDSQELYQRDVLAPLPMSCIMYLRANSLTCKSLRQILLPLFAGLIHQQNLFLRSIVCRIHTLTEGLLQPEPRHVSIQQLYSTPLMNPGKFSTNISFELISEPDHKNHLQISLIVFKSKPALAVRTRYSSKLAC